MELEAGQNLELDYGSEKSTLDDKGRIIIPVEFRKYFQGKLLLTYGNERCALIMTPSAWERFVQEIMSQSDKRQRRLLSAKHLQQVQQVELDRQGRIPISIPIRTYANLNKSCMVARDVDKMTIWDFDGWYNYLKDNDTEMQAAFDSLEI